MPFSEVNQPTPQQRVRQACRKGHSLETGDANVRVTRAGKRLCRACEDVRRQAHREKLTARRDRILRGVPKPFTLDKLDHEEEVYENTPLAVLTQYDKWLQAHLKQAQAANPGAVYTLSYGTVRADSMVLLIERELPLLQSVLVRRALAQMAEEDKTGNNPQSSTDVL